MRIASIGFVLILAVLWVGPATAADDKKPMDPAAAKEKLINSGKLPGRVVEVDPSEGTMTLHVTLRYAVLNPSAVAQLADLRQQLVEALQISDPVERLQRAQEIRDEVAQAQAELYNIEEQEIDVPLQLVDDVKVRVLKPPTRFDDKGRVKKYTAKELKELKGTENLPGYPSALAAVKAEQIVEVSVARKKGKPKDGEEPKLLATKIVIASETFE